VARPALCEVKTINERAARRKRHGPAVVITKQLTTPQLAFLCADTSWAMVHDGPLSAEDCPNIALASSSNRRLSLTGASRMIRSATRGSILGSREAFLVLPSEYEGRWRGFPYLCCAVARSPFCQCYSWLVELNPQKTKYNKTDFTTQHALIGFKHPHLPLSSALHNRTYPCPLTSDRTHNARAPTSPRSIGFCAIWESISSNKTDY